MKKVFFLATIIALCTTCLFVITSCEKEEKMCTCTETDYGYSSTQQVDPSSFGAKNCSDLAVKLRMANGSEFDYNCY